MNFFRRNIGGGGGHANNGGGSADNLISSSHITASKLQDMYIQNKFGSTLTTSNMVDCTSPSYDQKDNLAR